MDALCEPEEGAVAEVSPGDLPAFTSKLTAKDKADALKRPRTGGGPKPSSPTPPETMILDVMADKPSAEDLSCGIDTEDFTHSIPVSEQSILPVESANYDSVFQPDIVPVDLIVSDDGGVPITTKRKRLIKIQNEEILTLKSEREKLEAERIKLKQETEFYREQTALIMLKKEKVRLENEMLKKIL